jgi:hypothetical protein
MPRKLTLADRLVIAGVVIAIAGLALANHLLARYR